jgi:hypothetical protein
MVLGMGVVRMVLEDMDEDMDRNSLHRDHSNS